MAEEAKNSQPLENDEGEDTQKIVEVDDNGEEIELQTSATGGAKKKIKKKKKGQAAIGELNGEELASAASAANVGAVGVEQLQKVFQKMMIENNSKSKDKKFQFWDTQPVPKLGMSCNSFYCITLVRDFDEKTHQKETLKTTKKLVIIASNRSTYSKFHNENIANRTF